MAALNSNGSKSCLQHPPRERHGQAQFMHTVAFTFLFLPCFHGLGEGRGQGEH